MTRAMTPFPIFAVRGILFAVLFVAASTTDADPVETIVVDLKLRTGGSLSGAVVDYTEHGLVVVSERTPYVFSFGELTSGSAYVTKRDLLAFSRGGEDKLTAADRFELGTFALSLDRNDLAAREFREATSRDKSYEPRVRSAFDEFRKRRESGSENVTELRSSDDSDPQPVNLKQQQGGRTTTETLTAPFSGDGDPPAEARRQQVDNVYRTFGAKVHEVISKDIVLLETDHFLIWTDWEPKYRDRLPLWCEGMYDALCQQLGIAPDEPVFLAKCPVFCFRIKPRFQKFAQYFDGYSGENAIGYTRSIEANGHVHIATLRQGRSRLDFDQFACTLVHEGTHAFVHRLGGPRLLPHWVNEGLAEMTAERVLGDRCPAGENANLLARCYVRYDWPIQDLLSSVDPIGVEDYPLAHSVTMFLKSRGREPFRAFIRSLTEGRTVSDALARHYNGLTLDNLEHQWRAWVQDTAADTETVEPDPLPAAAAPESAGGP